MVVLAAPFSLITLLLFWLPGVLVQHWMLPNQGLRSMGRWLGITMAGIIFGILFIYSLAWFLLYVVHLDILQNANHGFIFFAICTLAVVSVVVITQWLLLRRQVAFARRWALASGIGGTLIWAFNLYLMAFLGAFTLISQFPTLIISLLVPLLGGSALGWVSGWAITTYDARFRHS